MRYAIISDIHANLEAFRAVLDRIAGLRVDRILCLGDLVGYNADPNACIEIARSEHMITVLGNHDAVACGLAEPDTFNPLAQAAIFWTRKQLTPENRDFLRTLPRELAMNDLFLCHGTVHDTNHYILSTDDVKTAFRLMEALPEQPSICLHGHSHLPSAFRLQQGIIDREPAPSITLSPSARYLLNPGSVGQPRDGDPEASFLFYDDRDKRATRIRVDYDRTTCQDKIIAAGLPPKLALRLDLGR